jgi:ParB-like chromosome segregation protein Spo0J
MEEQVLTWKDRIIGQDRIPPDQLLANPFNYRTHPKFQQEVMESVLQEVGWVQQIIVNKRTGHVIDGHMRIMLAMRHDETEVPVLYVDLDIDEERLVLSTCLVIL